MFWLVFFAALGMPSLANAQVVQHCAAADGQVLYTFGPCPDGSAGTAVRAINPPPGSVAPRARPVMPRQPVQLTIVERSAPGTAGKSAQVRGNQAAKKAKRARYQPPALAH